MKTLHALGFTLFFAGSAWSSPADTVMVRTSHSDAYTTREGNEVAAKDATQTMWVGKDRLRVETDEKTMIVRLDTQKMYVLDAKEKSAAVIDLPFDMKKYLPAEAADTIVNSIAASSPTAKLEASGETKKIKEWTAHKYVLTITPPQGMTPATEEIWTTKDIKLDPAIYQELARQITSMRPGESGISDERRKLDGIPVLVDRTSIRNGTPVKIHEELVSVEEQDAPEGSYDVPAGYTEKPFDPMSDMNKARGMRQAPTKH